MASEKKRLQEESQKLAEDEDASMFDERLNKGRSACERVTEEEFEFQARVNTRQEIRKLVTSTKYEALLAAKGKELAEWNWQLHDKLEGYFPNNDEEQKVAGQQSNGQYERVNQLEKQLIKIDEDIRRESKAKEAARKSNGIRSNSTSTRRQ